MCQWAVLIVGVIALTHTNSVQGQSLTPTLAIKPRPAISNEAVEFTVSHTKPKGTIGNIAYVCSKNKEEYLSVSVRCSANKESTTLNSLNAKVTANCEKLIYTLSQAKSDDLKGNHMCKVIIVNLDFTNIMGDSQTIPLSVGDKTPPITKFEAVTSSDKQVVVDKSTLKAGTNLSVTCETGDSDPKPKFTVSITGKETRYNMSLTNKVFFYEVVPKQPKVEFRCEVFNGFGESKQKNFSIISEYLATNEDITMPDELQINTAEELVLCSAPNNPPVRFNPINVEGDIFEDGYPMYTEANGMSKVIVKFGTAAQQKPTIELTCSLPNGATVKKSVNLTGAGAKSASKNDPAPSSAMMMVGIVVAAVIVFLIVVAALAYICKKRNADKENGNNKRDYTGVPKNDADARGSDKKLEAMHATPV